jgi:hypothetical protein
VKICENSGPDGFTYLLLDGFEVFVKTLVQLNTLKLKSLAQIKNATRQVGVTMLVVTRDSELPNLCHEF